MVPLPQEAEALRFNDGEVPKGIFKVSAKKPPVPVRAPPTGDVEVPTKNWTTWPAGAGPVGHCKTPVTETMVFAPPPPAPQAKSTWYVVTAGLSGTV